MALLPALWACLPCQPPRPPALTCSAAAKMVVLHGLPACLNTAVTFLLGTCSVALRALSLPPGRAARLVWAERERRRGVVPPQPCADSDTEQEHCTLLRVAVPSPEGRASVSALPWLGAMPGGGQGAFTVPQPDRHTSGAPAWRCQAVPPWLRCSGEEALFSSLFYFKSRLSLKVNMVFWRK